MKNERRLAEMMLGIVLMITFSANAQITKLFPVTEEVSPKTTVPPIKDSLSNEPYSEKIVYPPPPGVRLSTISSTESALSTLRDLTTNNDLQVSSTTSSKTVVPTNKDLLPNKSNLSIISSLSSEGTSAPEAINFKQGAIPAPSTSQQIFNTEETNFEKSKIPKKETPVQDEVKLSSKLNLPIEKASTSTSVREAIQFKQETLSVAVLPLTTEGPFTTEVSILQKTTQEISDGKEVTFNAELPHDQTIKTSSATETTTASTVSQSIPTTTCTTPIGKNGECKDIRQCPSLLKLLMREPLLAENKLYLQRSQCGYENQTVLVCCADNVPAPILSPKWSLLPKPRLCGTMHENRLYGGYQTEIDSYSWMALLEYAKGGSETGFHCGGTLISNRYVLTAAHCVTGLPKNWSIKSVRLGEWDVSTTKDCSKYNDFVDCSDPHISVSVDEVIPHKGYLPTSKNQLHDIALIRLAIEVNSTDFIEPICLPHGENNLHAFDEQSLDLVGWGASPDGLLNNRKEKATAQVIQLNKCRTKYAEKNITLEQSQFCVEGRLKNDTCRIDSGGAVISFDTSNQGLGSFYIAGIQSFGPYPCWLGELPGVYTRVGEYLDWILDNIHV